MAKELMMGDELTGELKRIFDSYSNSYYMRKAGPIKDQSTDNTKKDQSTDNTKKDQSTDDGDQSKTEKILVRQDRINEKQFTENVMMAMLKTLRNLGLARDAYVDWLAYKSKKIEDEKTTLSEASSFTDISADGLLPKIISFGGGGSGVTAAITSQFPSSAANIDTNLEEYTNVITSLKEVGANETTLRPAIDGVVANIENLTKTAAAAPSPGLLFGLSLEQLIPIFIVAGVGMLAAVTFILKIWKNHRIRILEDAFALEVQEHWRKNTRPSMADCLFDLYKDLRFTMSVFYPNYKEVGFITAHDPIEASNTDDKIARRTIEEEIIQPESVEPSNTSFLISKEEKEADKDNKRRREREEEERARREREQSEASHREENLDKEEEAKTGRGGRAGEEGELE
jgi:hypothetical protein